MAKRKTVKVRFVLDAVNRMLASHKWTGDLVKGLTPEQAYRLGHAHLLEAILHESETYQGFNYLSSEWLSDLDRIPGSSPLKPDYDDTRRHYYQDGSLSG